MPMCSTKGLWTPKMVVFLLASFLKVGSLKKANTLGTIRSAQPRLAGTWGLWMSL